MFCISMSPHFPRDYRRGQEHQTFKDLTAAQQAVDIFHYEYQTDLPLSNWVKELKGGSAAKINTNRHAYLNVRQIKGIPVDGWKRPIQAVPSTNDSGHLSASFYSLCADGRSTSSGNDSDDINLWDEKLPWAGYYEHKRSSAFAMKYAITLVLFIGVATFLGWRAKQHHRMQAENDPSVQG